MDVRSLLDRLPLAEAAIVMMRYASDSAHLDSLFERHRGRCYERELGFDDLFHLVVESLVQHQGSGRQAFERAIEQERVSCSLPAIFDKLRRVPLPLSQAMLFECTDRVRALFPTARVESPVPATLQDFHTVIVDAKTLKNAARRLKCLQGLKVGVLGGKVLALLDAANGLVLGFTAHPDGDASDLRLLPEALPPVRERLKGPRLFVADRMFCDLLQMTRFTEDGDHFVLRYHKKLPFAVDAAKRARSGQDRFQRSFTEDWGWLGKPARADRRYVRRIVLSRPGKEDVVLVTDLLEAKAHPAADVLEVYLQRWGIERVFQQLSEVFGLLHLIGGTPQAAVFQAALCTLLYNILQVLRAHIAVARKEKPRELSPEQIFNDVKRELITVSTLASPDELEVALPKMATADELQRYLKRLLKDSWTERWRKATPSQRSQRTAPKGPYPRGGHTTVHREQKKHTLVTASDGKND